MNTTNLGYLERRGRIGVIGGMIAKGREGIFVLYCYYEQMELVRVLEIDREIKKL